MRPARTVPTVNTVSGDSSPSSKARSRSEFSSDNFRETLARMAKDQNKAAIDKVVSRKPKEQRKLLLSLDSIMNPQAAAMQRSKSFNISNSFKLGISTDGGLGDASQQIAEQSVKAEKKQIKRLTRRFTKIMTSAIAEANETEYEKKDKQQNPQNLDEYEMMEDGEGDETVTISQEHYLKMMDMLEEQRSLRMTHKQDKSKKIEQRLKNCLKVLEFIGQGEVTNYHKVHIIKEDDFNSVMGSVVNRPTLQNKRSSMGNSSLKLKKIDEEEESEGPARLKLSIEGGSVQALKSVMRSKIKTAIFSTLCQTATQNPRIINKLLSESRIQNQTQIASLNSSLQCLSIPPSQRSNQVLQSLIKFFLQFKFFNELQMNHGQQVLLNVLRVIHIMRVVKGTYIIDQGEEGDRFYVLLKGLTGVEITSEVPVPKYQVNAKFKIRLNAYLQYLYENLEKICWRRVPYAYKVRRFILRVRKERNQFQQPSKTITSSYQPSNVSSPRGKKSVHVIKTRSASIRDSSSKGGLNSLGSFSVQPMTHAVQNQPRGGLEFPRPSQLQISRASQSTKKSNDRRASTMPAFQTVKKSQSKLTTDQIILREDSSSDSSEKSEEQVIDSLSSEEEQRMKEELNKPLGQKLEEEDRTLYHRLERLQTIFDFSHAYYNKEVGVLNPGTQFGELALITSQKRSASIYIKETSYLAFLDAKDYQKVLKQADMQDIARRVSVLRQNLFFSKLSTNRLQKIQYYIKRIKVARNKVLFTEGEPANGIYLVMKGSMVYKKQVDFEVPVEAKTKNKWFKDEIRFQKINRQHKQMDLAFFEQNEIIGFEEILRKFILNFKEEQKKRVRGQIALEKLEQVSSFEAREFSCLGSALENEVLFFSADLVLPILRSHSYKYLEELFTDRRTLVMKALELIEITQNRIAGSKISQEEQATRNQQKIASDLKKLQSPKHMPLSMHISPKESRLASMPKQPMHQPSVQQSYSRHMLSNPMSPSSLHLQGSFESQSSERKALNSNRQSLANQSLDLLKVGQFSKRGPIMTEQSNIPPDSSSGIRPLGDTMDNARIQDGTLNTGIDMKGEHGLIITQSNERFTNESLKLRSPLGQSVAVKAIRDVYSPKDPLQGTRTQNFSGGSSTAMRRTARQSKEALITQPNILIPSSPTLGDEVKKVLPFQDFQANSRQNAHCMSSPRMNKLSLQDLKSMGQASRELKQLSEYSAEKAMIVPYSSGFALKKYDSSIYKLAMAPSIKNNTAASQAALGGPSSTVVLPQITRNFATDGSRLDMSVKELSQIAPSQSLLRKNMEDLMDYEQTMKGKDKNQLFLKDMKTFMGLRKVAELQRARKMQINRQKHQSIQKQRSNDFLQIVNKKLTKTMDKTEKSKVQKLMKSAAKIQSPTQKELEEANYVDDELAKRLKVVLKQIDTQAYQQVDTRTGVKETSKEQDARVKKQMESAMKEIDDTFNSMDLKKKVKRNLLDYSKFMKPAKKNTRNRVNPVTEVQKRIAIDKQQAPNGRLYKGSPRQFPDAGRESASTFPMIFEGNQVDSDGYLNDLQQQLLEQIGLSPKEWEELSYTVSSQGMLSPRTENSLQIPKKALQTQVLIQKAIERLTKRTQALLKKLKVAQVNEIAGIQIKNMVITQKDSSASNVSFSRNLRASEKLHSQQFAAHQDDDLVHASTEAINQQILFNKEKLKNLIALQQDLQNRSEKMIMMHSADLHASQHPRNGHIVQTQESFQSYPRGVISEAKPHGGVLTSTQLVKRSKRYSVINSKDLHRKIEKSFGSSQTGNSRIDMPFDKDSHVSLGLNMKEQDPRFKGQVTTTNSKEGRPSLPGISHDGGQSYQTSKHLDLASSEMVRLGDYHCPPKDLVTGNTYTEEQSLHNHKNHQVFQQPRLSTHVRERHQLFSPSFNQGHETEELSLSNEKRTLDSPAKDTPRLPAEGAPPSSGNNKRYLISKCSKEVLFSLNEDDQPVKTHESQNSYGFVQAIQALNKPLIKGNITEKSDEGAETLDRHEPVSLKTAKFPHLDIIAKQTSPALEKSPEPFEKSNHLSVNRVGANIDSILKIASKEKVLTSRQIMSVGKHDMEHLGILHKSGASSKPAVSKQLSSSSATPEIIDQALKNHGIVLPANKNVLYGKSRHMKANQTLLSAQQTLKKASQDPSSLLSPTLILNSLHFQQPKMVNQFTQHASPTKETKEINHSVFPKPNAIVNRGIRSHNLSSESVSKLGDIKRGSPPKMLGSMSSKKQLVESKKSSVHNLLPHPLQAHQIQYASPSASVLRKKKEIETTIGKAPNIQSSQNTSFVHTQNNTRTIFQGGTMYNEGNSTSYYRSSLHNEIRESKYVHGRNSQIGASSPKEPLERPTNETKMLQKSDKSG